MRYTKEQYLKDQAEGKFEPKHKFTPSWGKWVTSPEGSYPWYWAFAFPKKAWFAFILFLFIAILLVCIF